MGRALGLADWKGMAATELGERVAAESIHVNIARTSGTDPE